MDSATGLCMGCLRTIDEIVAWGAMPEATRNGVWALIDKRRGDAATQPQPPDAPPRCQPPQAS